MFSTRVCAVLSLPALSDNALFSPELYRWAASLGLVPGERARESSIIFVASLAVLAEVEVIWE